MTVKLGLFTMPFHHPDRDYGQILAEDQQAAVEDHRAVAEVLAGGRVGGAAVGAPDGAPGKQGDDHSTQVEWPALPGRI